MMRSLSHIRKRPHLAFRPTEKEITMPKIALIGAGSIIFATTLLNDMLGTECLEDSTFALMGPTKWKLEKIETWAKGVIAKNKLSAKVSSTTDRRKALEGADYVLLLFQIGGMEAYRLDYEIPLKYGVDQCLGQCVGPGGVFRGNRSIPVLASIMKDMEELCPKAVILNYVNPMAANCIGMGKSSTIAYVGLCHGVQTTLDLIAGYTNCKKSEIDFLCAGINHMAWFLKIEKDGKDLYPLLKANCEKPEYYINDKVRIEAMRHFGYFMTESTGHLSEYLPWFRKNREGAGAVLRPARLRRGDRRLLQVLRRHCQEVRKGRFHPPGGERPRARSKDYCSYVIEALETGQAVPAQRKRHEHAGLHREPAARLLRRGPDLCRQERAPADVRREAAHATGGREHDGHQRPVDGVRGGPGGGS